MALPKDRASPLLFERCPGLAKRPFLPLAVVPTPVARMTAVADDLGRDDVWMKRDDLVSPLYGGNKVRRYEYVLADALDKGATRIVTAGGIASTQATATAVFAKELGLPLRLHAFDQALTDFGKLALVTNAGLGADIDYGRSIPRTMFRAWRDQRKAGSYFIFPGAPNPLANVGYVDAMLELAGQVDRGELPRPDLIVLPTGSSGTLAALALGVACLGWETDIVGVRITEPLACNRFTIDFIAERTRRFLEKHGGRFPKTRLRYRLMSGLNGKGYGEPTPEARANIGKIKALIGRDGEVTYTGKAYEGVRRLARDPANAGKTILMWNTLSAVQPQVEAGSEARLSPELRTLLSKASVA